MEIAAHMELKTSVSNKRKRLHSGDAAIPLQLSSDDSHANQCPVSAANFSGNSVFSTKMCEDPGEIPGNSVCVMNQYMEKFPLSLDPKADEISLTSHGGFSNKKTEESMKPSGTKRKKRKFSTNLTAVTKMPSTAEIEEFFSAAEKQEQKRFAEKYNYDIVKDVPLEGRYQWVCLKP